MIERKYEYFSQKGNITGNITLRIEGPVETPEKDWECYCSIDFPDKKLENRIIGVDGVQALLLAIKNAKTILTSYANSKGLTVHWLGTNDLGLA